MRLRGGTNEEKNAMEGPCLALAIKDRSRERGLTSWPGRSRPNDSFLCRRGVAFAFRPPPPVPNKQRYYVGPITPTRQFLGNVRFCPQATYKKKSASKLTPFRKKWSKLKENCSNCLPAFLDPTGRSVLTDPPKRRQIFLKLSGSFSSHLLVL